MLIIKELQFANTLPSTFSTFVGIVSVDIPNGVEYIDEYSFKGCVNLQKITLPTTILRIGKAAFENCYNLGSVPSTGIFYKGTEEKWRNIKINRDGNSVIVDPIQINFGA